MTSLLPPADLVHAERDVLLGQIGLMQEVLQNITERISLVDRDGYLVYTVQSVAKVYGCSIEDLIGVHQSELFSEGVYESHIKPAFERALAGEEVIETALMQFMVDADEKYNTHLDYAVSPRRDSNGEIIGVVYRVMDKERNVLDEELALTRQQLTDFADASSDWRWEMDKDLRFTWFSKRLEEIYGISVKDHIGKKRSMIAADADEQKKWQQHIETMAARKPFRNFDYRIQLSEDNVRWGRISGVPIINDQGEFNGYRGVGTDISELKAIELAAEQSHTRFMRAIDHYPGAFVLVDKSKVVVACNLWFIEFLASLELTIDVGDPIEKCIREMAYCGKIESAVGREEDWVDDCIEDFHVAKEPEELLRNGVWYRTVHHHLPDGSCLFTMTDISRARVLEQKLIYQARHDALTQLPNRTEFESRITKIVADKSNHSAGWFIGYLDLDRFKIVNDTVGHAAGDQLLSQVASIIGHGLHESDTLARLGGDEFGLLIQRDSADEVIAIADQINRSLNDFRFAWESKIFSVNASIGLVEITESNFDVSGLLSCADIACYTAKDLGRSQAHLYKASNSEQLERQNELLMASALEKAIADDKFVLYAQPIARVAGNGLELCHYEILIRLYGQGAELIQPGAFIPAAERFGIMNQLDRWVIRNALKQLSAINSSGTDISITINLSGQSLTDKNLTEFVQEQLQVSGVPPEKICFELTETAAISNLENADYFIRSAKKLGCKFALDDFGSGLSSFAYIKHFPVDFLKIDGSFVRDIIDDPTDKVMVNAINQMAHVLGMRTIAEFVENDQILEDLRLIGVDMVQGFGIGKPQPFVQGIADSLGQTDTKKAA